MALRAIVLILLLAALPCPLPAAGQAAGLGDELRRLSLDPDQCYRVRDLELQREDIRLYLTDGLLIFARPAGGRRVVAVFRTAEAGDDAEVLLRPPDRSERASLARATGSPNLSEHFHTAIFVFGDGGAEELLERIRAAGPKPRPDEGLLLAGRYGEAVRNFAQSFQVRLVRDILAGQPREGIFYAALASAARGNFDLMFDPLLPEQVILGEVSPRSPGRFDVWTSFLSRSRRKNNTLPPEDAFVEDYRIEAAVQPDLRLDLRVRASIKPQREVQGALAFELAPQMQVLAARIDGAEVEVFRRDSLRANLVSGHANEPFLLILPRPLQPGSAHEAEFELRGDVIRRAGNNVYYVGARTNWYPSRGYHFTKFDLTFRVPKELRAVATGDMLSESEEGDWRIARFRTSAPVRLAGFNVGSYDSVELRTDHLRVEVFANRTVEPALQPRPTQILLGPQGTAPRVLSRQTPQVINIAPPAPNPQARMKELAAELASAMQWMASQFGPPPLESLTVSPIPGNFGQGFPGLVYLSTISYLPEKERPAPLQTVRQHTFYSEVLLSHEAAHQWWGNLVTSATYRDEWIQEALANYCALMMLERKKGAKALETTLDEYREELLRQSGEPKRTLESTGPITWGARLRAENGVDPWRVIIYNKGSWILHMLRRRMGDAKFLVMLSETRKRYAYRALNTEQFRELAAAFLPDGDPDPRLEGFFEAWVYSTGIPVLETSVRTRGKAPSVEVAVTIRQSGAGQDFSLDLPVVVRLPGAAKPLVRWIRTGDEPATVVLRLPAPPARVDVAPGNGVLAIRR